MIQKRRLKKLRYQASGQDRPAATRGAAAICSAARRAEAERISEGDIRTRMTDGPWTLMRAGEALSAFASHHGVGECAHQRWRSRAGFRDEILGHAVAATWLRLVPQPSSSCHYPAGERDLRRSAEPNAC